MGTTTTMTATRKKTGGSDLPWEGDSVTGLFDRLSEAVSSLGIPADARGADSPWAPWRADLSRSPMRFRQQGRDGLRRMPLSPFDFWA